MIFLSYAAIRYANEICQEKSYYKVVIVSPNKEMRKFVYLYLQGCLDCDDIREVNGSCCEKYDISYNNGSMIRICSGIPNEKGNKCHLLIADKEIDREMLDCVFLPMEINEWVGYDLAHTMKQNGSNI